MTDLTRQSDEIMRSSSETLKVNREGGRHRRSGSIGDGSAKAKRKIWLKRLRNMALAILAIWIAAGVIGFIVNGIGFWGLMTLLLTTLIAIGLFGSFPKAKVPKQADLNKGDVKQMVSKTELWLEHQMPALPPPAATLVRGMGVQLDTLGDQLTFFEPSHPAAQEIRSLVGETLPETISAYRKIPQNLRREKSSGGASPDDQLIGSLGKISEEIDSISRQIAAGSIDDLAIRNRYLDYKYGSGPDGTSHDGKAAPALTDQSGDRASKSTGDS